MSPAEADDILRCAPGGIRSRINFCEIFLDPASLVRHTSSHHSGFRILTKAKQFAFFRRVKTKSQTQGLRFCFEVRREGFEPP